MHSKLRNILLGRWAHLVGGRPRAVLVIAAVTAGLCIAFTAAKLQFQPDRNDLIADSLPWNQTFIRWQNRFPGKHDLIVIIDRGPRPAATIAQTHTIIDSLGQAIAKSPGVVKAQWKHPQAQFNPKTIRLLPLPAFERQVAQLGESRTLLASPSFQAMIGAITRQLRDNEPKNGATTDEAAIIAQIDGLTHLIESLGARLTDDASGASDGTAPRSLASLMEAGTDAATPFRYLTDDDRFYFMRITPRLDADSLNEFGTAIEAIRAVLAAHRESAEAAGVSFGLTGIPVIEMDETQIATTDSTIASIASVVLILILLMLAFYAVRTPLLAVLSLLVGIAWSFGYATLFVGHLQVISVVFTVMLLSLGIAYGIHIASRFELVRHDYSRGPAGFTRTLRDTIQTIGPGIFTGAVTTAAAFFTTVFTDFKGVAEMGHIAGAGVLLCLLAMFSVFPAMLRLMRASRRHFTPMGRRSFHFFEERWVKPFVARPWITVIVALALTAASLAAVSQMRFDFDLLKLFPRNVPSVDWQTRLAEAGRPIYFGVSVCDSIDAARKRAEAARKLPTIAGVGGIGLLFPDDEPRKIELLSATRKDLADPLAAALRADAPTAAPPDALATFQGLQLAMTIAAARDMPAPIRAAFDRLRAALTATITTLTTLPAEARAARIDRLRGEYESWRRSVAARISAALDVSPLAPADFPPQLLSPYIDPKDGSVALEIYPRLPAGLTSPLDPAVLPAYIADLKTIDADITGPAPQIYHSGVLIKDSYKLAGLFAFAIVFVLVYLDFLSLTAALLSLIPVSVGFSITFGIMWLLDMHINPANIIVLPLMFGIGIDAGVHMVHRYIQSPDARPLGLTDGTGKGITITNLATVLGFATLMFARHRGVAGLGFVLTVGIALTTLACWTVTPATLELIRRRRA